MITDPYVFISYRHAVSALMAQLVYTKLTGAGVNCYLDVERMDEEQVDECLIEVQRASHLVLLLDSGTLDRCSDSQDIIRKEVGLALEQEVNVIPIYNVGFDRKAEFKTLQPDLIDLRKKKGIHYPPNNVFVKWFFQELEARIVSAATR